VIIISGIPLKIHSGYHIPAPYPLLMRSFLPCILVQGSHIDGSVAGLIIGMRGEIVLALHGRQSFWSLKKFP